MSTKPNAVASLRQSHTPHPSRTSSIKQWHLAEISADDPAVAILAVSVTASGQIQVKGMGLDHIHARIVLSELDALREQMQRYVEQEPANNVIQIRA